MNIYTRVHITPAEEAENKSLWDTVVKSIVPPPQYKTNWAPNNIDLSLVIVEPREHPWLAACLYNMAHVYGGKNVGLYIYHGTANKQYVYDIVSTWSGVNLIQMNIENLSIDQYNQLLTMNTFWMFPSSHALLFQTDTLIRRPIDAHFFNFQYVGAPWPFYVSKKIATSHNVGNGGFSLRDVNVMNMITLLHSIPQNLNEDIFFREKLSDAHVPSTCDAVSFSVEHIFHENPCGLHQAWRFHKKDRLKQLLRDIPGATYVP